MEIKCKNTKCQFVPDDFERGCAMRMLIDSGVVQLPSDQLEGFIIKDLTGENVTLANRFDDEEEDEEESNDK